MGLNNEEKKTYLSMMKGKVVIKVTEDTPGAIKRINADNNEVFELHYSNVTGYLTKIETKDGKYGKQWVLHIDDGEENFVLQFPYSGGYAGSFFRALPNVKLDRPIKFSPYCKTEMKDGKAVDKVSLYLNQVDENGKNESVKWFFTKEEPNNLPPLKQITHKGALVWDDTEQLAFFADMVMGVNAELEEVNKNRRLGNVYAEAKQTLGQTVAPAKEENLNSIPEDDLPF